MPINIYSSLTNENVAYLSSESWDLPTQIDDLQNWLKATGKTLNKSEYVADIGFDIRPDACGGGAVLSANLITILSEIGMEIHLSEYPGQL